MKKGEYGSPYRREFDQWFSSKVVALENQREKYAPELYELTLKELYSMRELMFDAYRLGLSSSLKEKDWIARRLRG